MTKQQLSYSHSTGVMAVDHPSRADQKLYRAVVLYSLKAGIQTTAIRSTRRGKRRRGVAVFPVVTACANNPLIAAACRYLPGELGGARRMEGGIGGYGGITAGTGGMERG